MNGTKNECLSDGVRAVRPRVEGGDTRKAINWSNQRSGYYSRTRSLNAESPNIHAVSFSFTYL